MWPEVYFLEEIQASYQQFSKSKKLKILVLFFGTLDLENLSCTLHSKEILKLDPYEIGLIVISK